MPSSSTIAPSAPLSRRRARAAAPAPARAAETPEDHSVPVARDAVLGSRNSARRRSSSAASVREAARWSWARRRKALDEVGSAEMRCSTRPNASSRRPLLPSDAILGPMEGRGAWCLRTELRGCGVARASALTVPDDVLGEPQESFGPDVGSSSDAQQPHPGPAPTGRSCRVPVRRDRPPASRRRSSRVRLAGTPLRKGLDRWVPGSGRRRVARRGQTRRGTRRWPRVPGRPRHCEKPPRRPIPATVSGSSRAPTGGELDAPAVGRQHPVLPRPFADEMPPDQLGLDPSERPIP